MVFTEPSHQCKQYLYPGSVIVKNHRKRGPNVSGSSRSQYSVLAVIFLDDIVVILVGFAAIVEKVVVNFFLGFIFLLRALRQKKSNQNKCYKCKYAINYIMYNLILTGS